jgi:tRNA-2-methylthio-N6-dimethylallyladenosine synthase
MGREYTAGEYRDLAVRLRRARPGLALSTDVIVGFPGETDDDFLATLRLIEELRFAVVFAFKYSPRPGTAALRLGEPIDAALADRRLQSLLAMQSRIQLELNRELEGRTLEVLVTSRGREAGRRVGRTACHRLVHFEGPREGDRECEPGALVDVRVARALPHSLVGSLVAPLGAGRYHGLGSTTAASGPSP